MKWFVLTGDEINSLKNDFETFGFQTALYPKKWQWTEGRFATEVNFKPVWVHFGSHVQGGCPFNKFLSDFLTQFKGATKL